MKFKRLSKYSLKKESLKLIGENQNNIELFMNTPIENFNTMDITELHKFVKAAVDEYTIEYKKMPQGMDALEFQYNEIKGQFYNKYYDFAKKCGEIANSSMFSVSGYGMFDFVKLNIKKMCNWVDYNFPYGWRSLGEYVSKQ